MSIHLKLVAIKKIEERGISDFEFDSINWWPLIRVYLCESHRIKDKIKSENEIDRNKLIYLKRILWDMKIWMQTRNQFKKINNAGTYRSLSSVDTCFITSEDNYKLNVEGKLINRYLDPLFLETSGSKAIFVRSTKKQIDYVVPDLLTTNYFELKWVLKKQFIGIIQTVFLLKKRISYSQQYEKQIIRMIDHIKSVEFFETINFSELAKWIDQTKRSADIATSIFKVIKPKQLIQYCYYFPEQFGYTLAANKLGVKTVDYQHGSQNEFHYAYGSWSNVPQIGYELLPKEFWVYSKREEQNLLESFSGSTHKVKVKGNKWIKYWKSNTKDDGNLFWLESLKIKGFKIVLFSMSDYLLLEGHFFWEYLKNSQNNLYILFRLHPAHLYLKQILINKLNSINFNNYNIDDATRTELYDLLNVVDLHITQNSTIAEEALNFGLPTIIMDEIGRVYFEDYIDNGEMFFPTNIRDFNTLISQMLAAKIKS